MNQLSDSMLFFLFDLTMNGPPYGHTKSAKKNDLKGCIRCICI